MPFWGIPIWIPFFLIPILTFVDPFLGDPYLDPFLDPFLDETVLFETVIGLKWITWGSAKLLLER